MLEKLITPSTETINSIFKSQEKRHRSNKDLYKANLAKMDRVLFNLTKAFTLDDWRIIRGGKFWSINDKIASELGKKIHLLKKVKQYLNAKKPIKTRP